MPYDYSSANASISDISCAVSSATVTSVSLRSLRMVRGLRRYVSKRRSAGHDHAGIGDHGPLLAAAAVTIRACHPWPMPGRLPSALRMPTARRIV